MGKFSQIVQSKEFSKWGDTGVYALVTCKTSVCQALSREAAELPARCNQLKKKNVRF